MRKICGYERTQEGYFEHPHFLKILQYVADGKLQKVKILLNENPFLVMLRGKEVTTPTGITVMHTSLLEPLAAVILK